MREYDIAEARKRLREDAARSAPRRGEAPSPEWLDPELWGQYLGREARPVYQSFSDAELLDILREKAAELGRNPGQKDLFCVYRMYIRRRFTNWPRAMTAAGLRPPKAGSGE